MVSLGGPKTTHYASVLELVYRLVSKTSVERLAGSEPARSTTWSMTMITIFYANTRYGSHVDEGEFVAS